jgi:hypothetical protein
VITNEPGPYKVEISRSMKLSTEDTIAPETGAIVVIEDDENNVITLTEESPGIYKTDDQFQGELGKSYVLKIFTTDGSEYASQPVKLRDVPPIDSIYVRYSSKISYETGEQVEGINIDISTGEWDPSKNFYLKWDYTETWKIEPKWRAWFKDDIHFEPCWQIDYSNEIIIQNTALSSANVIKDKNIIYLDENSYKPFFGYSVEIRQYSINESVFNFLKMVEENNEENGGIFDNIPYNAISNIECCNNKNKKVFGYFDASSVDKIRTYFIAPIYGLTFKDKNEGCNFITTTVDYFRNEMNGEFVYVIDYDELVNVVRYTTQRRCVDCTIISTTNKKPAFWNYE